MGHPVGGFASELRDLPNPACGMHQLILHPDIWPTQTSVLTQTNVTLASAPGQTGTRLNGTRARVGALMKSPILFFQRILTLTFHVLIISCPHPTCGDLTRPGQCVLVMNIIKAMET